MGKISVVINTYNAEQYLQQILDSVRDFDEVVVCDMESTDSTASIAHKNQCKFVTFPKGNITIVEPARNFAIQSASNEWVLVVDADEIVTPQLREELYHRIARTDCPNGLYVPRRNMFFGVYVRDFHPDYQLRFFRKDSVHWPSTIHAQPEVTGRVDKITQKTWLLHLMDETMHEYIDKLNAYTDNELNRKSHKQYGFFALLWRPAWRFFHSYVQKGGFRLGTRGFIRAQLAATYQFVLVSKFLERKYRSAQTNP